MDEQTLLPRLIHKKKTCPYANCKDHGDDTDQVITQKIMNMVLELCPISIAIDQAQSC